MPNATYPARSLIAVCLQLLTRWNRPKLTHTPKTRTIFFLVCAWFVVLLAIDFTAAGRYEGFNEYGISSFLARLGLLFMFPAIAVLHFTSATMRKALGIGVTLMCLYAVMILAFWGFARGFPDFYNRLPQWLPMGIWIGIVVWILTAAYRAGPLVWNKPSRLAGYRFVMCLLLPFLLIPDQPIVYGNETPWSRTDLWSLAQAYLKPTTTQVSDQQPTDTTNWEKVIYAQPALIEAQLKAIQPTDPTLPHVYFIGMAPNSGQTVFAKEINAARDIVDMHFNARGRSIVLQNTSETTDTVALASNSSLLQIAQGMKAKVNPEKDVLVLFVTSHGAKDYISVDQYPLNLNPITPKSLKEALTASGFQNRVVILSACHAGSFIDDLKDDHTAIIAAAREDRTSFGCSNDRDWTFFGDALFNHGFRETRSLQGAFAIATKLISDWEAKEKITPSEPQIFVGTAIEKRWNEMTPGFDQSKSAPTGTSTHKVSSL